MEEVPSVIFRKGPGLDIAQALISKSKITLETSFLRTLFLSFDSSAKQESKFKITSGGNVFVIGTSKDKSGEHSKAILLLSELLKGNLRHVVQQFNTNRKKT